MVFQVQDNNTQFALFIVFVVFTPFCILATALRFVSSRLTSRKVGAEDWLALAALFCYLAWVFCTSFALYYANGQDVSTIGLKKITLTLKWSYAAAFFFMPNQLFAKGSILLLYYRIFGMDRTYARFIYAFAIAQFCLTLANIFGDAFQCTPVKKSWDVLYEGGHCIRLSSYLAGSETVNSLIDFSMVALALFMLRDLRTTSLKTKFRLGLVFVIGGLAGIIGFIKFGMAFHSTVNNQAILALWATVQMAFSIICCCAITYKPLLDRVGIFSRLASRFSPNNSRARVGQASKPSFTITDNPSRSEVSGQSDGWIDLGEAGHGKGHVVTKIDASGHHEFGLDGANLESVGGRTDYPMETTEDGAKSQWTGPCTAIVGTETNL